jgi:hypothetical protein
MGRAYSTHGEVACIEDFGRNPRKEETTRGRKIILKLIIEE